MDSLQPLLNIPLEFSKHLELRGCTKVRIKCYLHDLGCFIGHVNKGNDWIATGKNKTC